MAEKFLMPKLSPTMEEGQIARWVKNEGETYDAGETLAEVDTDKATMEMTALTGGTVLKILKVAGETALLGEAIAIIGTKGEDITALLSEVSANGVASSTPQPSVDQAKAEAAVVATMATVAEQEPLKSDLDNLRQRNNAIKGRLIVSPIAARMAVENRIDVSTIDGTGPNGRIIKRDIEAAITGHSKTDSRLFMASSFVGSSAFSDEPTSQMRRVIASRLGESIGPIPTFYLTMEIEMENAFELRKAINASVPDDQKVSVNDIVVKVAAMALVKHPFVNASYQDKNIRFYEQADIGVAVAVDEGLITPVIRGANHKGFLEISSEIKALAAKAKAKRLQPEEYSGATFSISNLGMFGIKEFTAIINPPEAGILAVGGAAQTPVVRNGEVVIRNIMNVTMSCDHRVIDGATGSRFLQTFKQMLEQPAMMLV
ncbi:MAG: 2-oxo acid dehydrogenase subunit E2 [Pyrinomonadaceae bacterium]|nr:2-oxo acid dehydrogenase subunit E2 [Pyrinomonadaceae bacterium]